MTWIKPAVVLRALRLGYAVMAVGEGGRPAGAATAPPLPLLSQEADFHQRQ